MICDVCRNEPAGASSLARLADGRFKSVPQPAAALSGDGGAVLGFAVAFP
jgi:hypothetical protein